MRKLITLAIGVLLVTNASVGFARTGSPPKIETTTTVFKPEAQITVNYEMKTDVARYEETVLVKENQPTFSDAINTRHIKKQVQVAKAGTAKGSVFHRYNKLPHNSCWRTIEQIA